jgi:hypothetical protein
VDAGFDAAGIAATALSLLNGSTILAEQPARA